MSRRRRPRSTEHRPLRTVAAALVVPSLLVASCGYDADVAARRAEPVAAPERGATDPDPATTDPATTDPGTTEPGGPRPTTDEPPPATSPSTPEPEPEREREREPSFDQGDATAPTTPPAATPSIQIDVDPTDVLHVGDAKVDRPYDEFVAAALVDLEAWMTDVHPLVHGEVWEPLAGGVYPSYAGRSDIPGCGEASTDPADVTEYVAFYCSRGDFMVYDDDAGSVLGELVGEFGPSVMGVVLAHEYGHVAQDRTGDLARNLPSILVEQQADCVAGAWVRRTADGRSPYLTMTEADIRGALITMVAVRDPVGTDQFDDNGHGSAFDRIGAFQEGYLGGPERCAELLDTPLPLMPNEFTSGADRLNDGDLPFGYDDGQIAPLIVGTLNRFWPFQLDELGAGSFAPMTLTPVDTASEVECSTRPRVVAPGLATCAADQVVYLHDGFARRLYDDPVVGSADFAVGYFIGLAWADEAQTTLGSSLSGSARALANDCLVGAWTRDLDPRRPSRPDEVDERGIISAGDLDEAVVAAIEIGDASSADDLLGTPFEKIDAFRAGVLGQVDACLDRLDP